MREPLVTIILPTYNHVRFISTCVDNVLAQTYSYWELIFLDDCSTDGTSEIVAQSVPNRTLK